MTPTFRSSVTIVFVSLICLSWTFLVESTHTDELYFTDLDRIQLFNRSAATVIFQDTKKLTEALECNICDQKIYWVVLPDKIKRGIPGNESSIETIIDSDLQNPRGLALDWKGNNIYFSHSRRIEVASCDGKHRKVLLKGLTSPGSVAINLQTGHLYYVDEHDVVIKRIHLDGATNQVVHNAAIEALHALQPPYKIIGLAIDSHNQLFWTAQNQTVIRYINMTEWEETEEVPTFLNRLDPNIIQVTYRPYELLITNDHFYFTETRVMTENAEIRSPGALYSLHMESHNISTLLSNNSISPHDICTFYHSTTPVDNTGCSVNNGGCQVFCLTVPNGSGGTQPQCDCPTGIQLKNGTECLEFPDKFLLTTQVLGLDVTHSEIRQVSLDIPDQHTDVLVPVNISGTQAVHIAYDLVFHKIYWTELDPPLIRRADLNGSNAEVFVNFSLSCPQDLAVDPFSRNLFWIDSGLDRIEVARLDNGRMRKVLIDSDLDHPQGLALDTKNEYIYWTDLDSNHPRIERARMNGTDRTSINTRSHVVRIPANIAVDPLTGYVYWVDVDGDNRHIAMYDGEHDEIVVSSVGDTLGLAVLGDHVYWTDRGGSKSLWRANKISGSGKTGLLSGTSGLLGLVAVNVSAETVNVDCRVVVVGDPVHDSECGQFCLGMSCGCADNFNLLPNGRCEDPPPTIFAVTSEYVAVLIGPSDPDSMSRETWSEDYTLDITASVVDVDYKENMIYWISTLDGLIYRRSANRSNTSTSEKVISCCLGNVSDLAVDWYGRNLYWVDPVKRVIELSKLNGEGRTVLSVIPESYAPPVSLVLDPLRGDLYWTPKSPPIIYRAKMNHPVIEETEVFWDMSSNESDTSIAGMALDSFDIDSSSDFLYWGFNTPGNMVTIISQDVTSPMSTAETKLSVRSHALNVDVFRGVFYYHSETFIGPRIKGRNNNIVNTNSLNSPLNDFKIMHHSVQPGAHRCGVKNGGCGGSSLCLVEDGSSHVCRCPPQFAAREVTDNAGERHLTCFDSDSFLLLATNNTIHYLPVPDDNSDFVATPSPLPLGVVDDIKVIAYDPVNKSVLWMDSSARILHSVAVDSSSNVDIPLSTNEPLVPTSFAYDWLGGHIFVTETKSFQIEALSINAPGLSSLLDFNAVRSIELDLVGEVVLGDDSVLYWTTLDPLTSLGRNIKSMSLRDLQPQNIDITGNHRIGKLTFVPGCSKLIWINRYRDNNHTIEMLDLSMGTKEVTIIAGLADEVQALTTIPASSDDGDMSFFLFWYNATDHMIYRYSSSSGEYAQYLSWQSPGDIVGFVGHRTVPIPISRPCLAESRPCSHLCLHQTTPSDHQCTCPPHRELTTDSATCSDLACSDSSSLLMPCGDDFGTCIPRAYFCDGIESCRGAEDESGCSCNTTSSFECLNSSTCVPLSAQCNGASECPSGYDEHHCCDADTKFGCFVSVGNNFPGQRSQVYRCLEIDVKCDGQVDCLDGSDEMCPTMLPVTNPTEKPVTQFNEITLIIVLVVVTLVPILVLFIICTCFLIKRLKTKREEYGISRTMIPVAPGAHEMNQRTDSQSEYRSEYSENTHTTDLNGRNGSAFGSVFKPHSADARSNLSGPPPSLVTNAKYHLADVESALDGDNHTILSVPMSQMSDEDMSEIIPPAPCPSINYSEYDTISAVTHMSSVSQRRFAGAPINNGMPIGNNGRNMGKNPLRPQFLQHNNYPEMNGNAYPSSFHQQSRYASMAHYYQHHQHQKMASNHMRDGGEGGSGIGNGKVDPLGHAPYHYQDGETPHNHDTMMQGNGVITRKELDSITRTETESTMSMTTENEELQEVFGEDHIPGAPPPGRPPSPVTECEYPPPLSPDSTISYDEDSDEYLSRYSHHH